ncbi:MAG: transglutaminase domain-containing protein, partial [Pseudomonadota bacterium]
RDGVAFGWGPRLWDETPEQTLSRGIGYSMTKSAALVTLLRHEGFEVRLVCAEIDARIVADFLAMPGERMDHGMVEIRLEGRWYCVDSHVLDRRLFRAAQARLTAEGRSLGYGTHTDGRMRFPGFAQFADVPGLRGYVWGRFDSLATFYDQVPEAHNRMTWIDRRLFGLSADEANERIAALRAGA